MRGIRVKKYCRFVGKLFFVILPFVSAMYGYALEGTKTISDAVFLVISLYFMNNTESPPNLYVEIARWAAPLMTVSGFFTLFTNLRNRLDNYKKYVLGESVAVFGEEKEANLLLGKLGKRGIKGNEQSCILADKYILMYNDEEKNFRFYQRNYEFLKSKSVFIKCESICPQSIEQENVHLFQYQDAQARMYWKQSYLFKEAEQNNYHIKIIIIGFSHLGQELLLKGLEYNIFSEYQQIEYHIFGEYKNFQALYQGIEQINDSVIYHDEGWYQNQSLIKEANRIIVCEEKDVISTLNDLLLVVPDKCIEIFNVEKGIEEIFNRWSNIHTYNFWDNADCVYSILNDKLYERAKQINLNYAILYGQAIKNDENKEKEWEKLDSFTRYSNISAADYHEIRLQMVKNLAERDGRNEKDYLPYIELLAHLEHIRWCRFHFLNNWSYGIPENGKRKDLKKRIHMDLVPYESLDESEKDKDRENIKILFSI